MNNTLEPITDALIEELLMEAEGTFLDFKRDQYKFTGASKDEKAELLKDIIAFANAFRHRSAFILIGVHEVQGGRAHVVGIVDHLHDASLQQFVNSKTNRTLDFRYHTYIFDGKHIGIIQIPVQERPFYLLKPFGGLEDHVAFMRRGSSTGPASIDDIYQMGRLSVARSLIPQIDVQFAVDGRLSGKHIQVEPTLLHLPQKEEIPLRADIPNQLLQNDHTEKSFLNRWAVATNYGTDLLNGDFYRDYADFLVAYYKARPIVFAVTNIGGALLANARLRFLIPKETGIEVQNSFMLPKIPKYHTNVFQDQFRLQNTRSSTISVQLRPDACEVLIELGSIQPKEELFLEELFIGSPTSLTYALQCMVYADNLPQPVTTQLTIDFEVQEVTLSAEELVAAITKFDAIVQAPTPDRA